MTVDEESIQGLQGVVMTLQGRLDGLGAPGVEQACLKRLEAGTTHLLLDLEGVDYISSAGLRSLLVVAKRSQMLSGRLRLCCLAPMVQEVLSLSGLGDLLQTLPTREEGLAALRS